MQPKRDGWASIGDVFSGLIGTVKQALVKSPPKALTPQSRQLQRPTELHGGGARNLSDGPRR